MNVTLSADQPSPAIVDKNSWTQVRAFQRPSSLLVSSAGRLCSDQTVDLAVSMNRFLHAIQIGSLATWSSISLAGAVGLWLGVSPTVVVDPVEEKPQLTQEILIGEVSGIDSASGENSEPASVASAASNDSMVVPEIPELPSSQALTALPDLPDLPPPPVPASQIATAPPAVDSTPVSSNHLSQPKTTHAGQRASGVGRGTPGTSAGRGAQANAGSGAGSQGVADGSRIAGGRMPAPIYPASARRMGQAGTVVVEFTVDHLGKVIAARAKVPSNYPLLDNEAVRTVRRWKFPPGPSMMKLERPITFKLQ